MHRPRGGWARLCLGLLLATGMFAGARADERAREAQFERVGSLVVCENTSCDRSVVEQTVSEIVAASRDGRTLVYADAALGAIGFVDIDDPAAPQGLGVVDLDGAPTAVAVAGRFVSPPSTPPPPSSILRAAWTSSTSPPAPRTRPPASPRPPSTWAASRTRWP